jgi:sphinganine-1-phosphate aldolase
MFDVLCSSGALIAGAWAAMHYMGEEYVVMHQPYMSCSHHFSGYISSCRDIVGAAKTIQQAIQNSFPELFILGKPQASVVAFGSRTPSLNILEVGDKMSKKGWHLNALQNPPGLHIACTVRTRVLSRILTRSNVMWQRLTVSRVDDFIRDLKDVVWDAKGNPDGKGTMVSLYGACNECVRDK